MQSSEAPARPGTEPSFSELTTSTPPEPMAPWATRALAWLVLPFAFLVTLGGGLGLLWLWREELAGFWIALAVIAVLALGTGVTASVVQRARRRDAWNAERLGLLAGAGPERAAGGGPTLTELLAEIERVQDHLAELVGEVNGERKGSSGRHATPVTVDVRDESEIARDPELIDTSDDPDWDDEDEPGGIELVAHAEPATLDAENDADDADDPDDAQPDLEDTNPRLARVVVPDLLPRRIDLDAEATGDDEDGDDEDDFFGGDDDPEPGPGGRPHDGMRGSSHEC